MEKLPRDLLGAIDQLRKERNAVILAHYYQEPDIQDVADFIGDSLQLARAAQTTQADVILFCGVHFMAETAKILNPDRIVVIPDLTAGCSLADACPAPALARMKAQLPDHKVVSYINCSAEVKALSDVICTSSNAERVIRSFPADQPILFAPDRNLGAWLIKRTGRPMTLWLALVTLIVAKTFLIYGLSRLFGSDAGAALRTGLDLAQGGEFGFVLLSLAAPLEFIPATQLQTVLAALVLSMLAAPFIIERSEHIVRHVSGADWMARAMELHNVAVQSMAVNRHVVVCGYGRSGQNLARLLDTEGVGFIALDVDPKRVKEAAAAGEHVVYGDAARREVLIAAGLLRARALVVTIADSALALRILSQVRDLRPGLPVVVRMLDDMEIDALKQAGATAVLAEIMEGSLMLASHTLVLLGVPLNRVLRRIRDTREQRYSLLRGFFHGASDAVEDAQADPRLMHSVLVTPGAAAIGKTLAELDFASCHVEIKAVRRPGITAQVPQPDARIDAGDVLVFYGAEHDCAAAEFRVMQG